MIDEDITLEDIIDLELKKSLILFSGGLDTTVLLYQLVNEGIPVQCLTFDYGQQAKEEIEHAKQTCEKLNISYEVMDITSLNISGELGEGGNIENSVDIIIPNRNSIFLAIATNYAITHGCEIVYIGSKLGETACLDETYEFIEEYNRLNAKSDITQVKIKAPLIYMDSEDVIEEALKLNVPLVDTWSCFGKEKTRCKKCKNCKALKTILEVEIAKYSDYLENLKNYFKELE